MEAIPILLFFSFAGFVMWAFSRAAAAARRRQALLVEQGFSRLLTSTGSGCMLGGFHLMNSAEPWTERIIDTHDFIAPFGTGDSRTITDAYQKCDPDRTITILSYQYSTGSGKHRTTHSHDVVFVEWDLLCPMLELREQGFFDSIAELVGVRDIQFESDEFNKRFRVQSPDPKFAYAFLHPQLMEQLLRVPAFLPLSMFNNVVMFSMGTGQGPDNVFIINQLIDLLREMTPEFLEQDHRYPFQPNQSALTAGARLNLNG